MTTQTKPLSERLMAGFSWLWLLVLIFVPLLIVLKISLSQAALAQPPYVPVFEFSAGVEVFLEKLSTLSSAAYQGLFDDSLYIASYLSSLRLAGLSTGLTLLVAYPLAVAISRAPARIKSGLILLAVTPFWTSFLIRVYAWIAILKDEGLLNHVLLRVGLIDAPLQIFATETAVLIGIVYSYLPFMVLPIFNALDRQDPALVEAASDLGASPFAAFWRVTFPLSLPGLIAGCLLVFVPAVGEFVIPDLLGGSDTLMIGRTLWSEFFDNRDWPTASAAAILLLVLLVIPMLVFERVQMRDLDRIR